MSEPIDRDVLEELLDSTGGDSEFFGELIDAYLADAPVQVTLMHRGVDEDDASLVLRGSHTLKSSSASLGALALADLCRDVEALARRGAVADAAALLPALEAELQLAEEGLGAARSELGGG